CMQAIQLPYSC
nr:immunoglobulin light chain junction region [Macaca mulatta]MOW73473.1 immunoglobulin light chain junction region [Macaca mulatta]MOW74500.1 immunoglobulin light chain junction region [Macaca mulatta]MOW75013.1 immunoglobulin light chain junction region [Macaca mulatta]